MPTDLQTLRDSIRVEYSEDSTDYFTDDIIDDYINDALQDISTLKSVNAVMASMGKIGKILPFDETYSITVSSSNDTDVFSTTYTGFTLPTDFIDAILIRIRSHDYNGKKITYNDFDLSIDQNSDDLFWYIDDTTVVLSKELDDDDIIHFRYHKLHETLSADGDEIDQRLSGYETMIENYVLSRMYRRDRMYDDSEYFKNQYIQDCLGYAIKQASRQEGRPMWKKIDRKGYWQNNAGGFNSGVTVQIVQQTGSSISTVLDGGT